MNENYINHIRNTIVKMISDLEICGSDMGEKTCNLTHASEISRLVKEELSSILTKNGSVLSLPELKSLTQRKRLRSNNYRKLLGIYMRYGDAIDKMFESSRGIYGHIRNLTNLNYDEALGPSDDEL